MNDNKLIQQCVDKYEEYTKLIHLSNLDLSAGACALCTKYLYSTDSDNPCYGCPVMLSTGLSHCHRTPYTSVRYAYSIYKANGPTEELLKRFHDACKMEAEFLKSLIK